MYVNVYTHTHTYTLHVNTCTFIYTHTHMHTYRYHSARVLMMSMYNKIHAGKSCMYIAHAHMHTQSHTHTQTHGQRTSWWQRTRARAGWPRDPTSGCLTETRTQVNNF